MATSRDTGATHKPSKPYHSLYPFLPPNTQILSKDVGPCTALDRWKITLTSLFFVGGLVWIPTLYVHLYRKYKKAKQEGDEKKKRLYWSLLASLVVMGVWAPHRKVKLGKWLKVKEWSVWDSWLRFFAFQVVTDASSSTTYSPSTRKPFDITNDPAILAVSPHGIFPFSLAMVALPSAASKAFGHMRLIVASATEFFPLIRTLLSWLESVDASKSAVHRALSSTSPTATTTMLGTPMKRLGLCPGGIGEMFEGYPKPNRLPNDECLILKHRKGFVKVALMHQLPVVPIYCFGGSKMFRRVQLPAVVERISNVLRISICLFFGVWGLPVPFRQRLLYAVGKPIYPPTLESLGAGGDSGGAGAMLDESNEEFQRQVNIMHEQFCSEMKNVFDRYKASYGWDHKELRIV